MKKLVILTILSALAYSQPASAQYDNGTVAVHSPSTGGVATTPTIAPTPRPVTIGR